MNALKNTLTVKGRHGKAIRSCSAPASESGEPFTTIGLFFLCAVFAVSAYSWGCGGRKPIVGQPPPTGPSATPPDVAENAKRSTDVPQPPGASKPNSPPKRANPAAVPVAAGYTEEGNASWYGEPFHGRRASNGETYDMYKLTAAHRTLPFETMVLVTNLSNGKSTTVRITDRGPFVENRIIDLSLAAAREIELVGPGVGRVRIEALGGVDLTAGYFTVQVGAFRDRANAERLRRKLSAAYSPVFVLQSDSPDGELFRVRVGKISGEEATQKLSEQLRDREGLAPIVIRLDEGTPAGGIR